MRIRISEVCPGLHPNEVVVSIKTREGPEQIVVHRRSIENDGIEIGYPILEDKEFYLVELPRETMRGLWRIWVNRDDFISDAAQRRRA